MYLGSHIEIRAMCNTSVCADFVILFCLIDLAKAKQSTEYIISSCYSPHLIKHRIKVLSVLQTIFSLLSGISIPQHKPDDICM